MENMEKNLVSKTQHVVEKLHKLECTLLGNRDDVWIMELLFKPGIHRYNLIEWILLKLDYNIEEVYEPYSSVEEKVENLESAVSDLGLLEENKLDIIKGIASVEEQLGFWSTVVDILWMDYKINSDLSVADTDEGVALSRDKSETGMSEMYEAACSSINKICESVNIEHLFEHKVQLLAPDIEKEIEGTPSKVLNANMPSLQDLKVLVKEKNSCTNLIEVCGTLSSPRLTVDESMDDPIDEDDLNALENEMSKVVCDTLDLISGDFNDVYNDLKPLIHHAKPDVFKDVGPEFRNTLPLLKNILKVKESFPKLKELDDSLLKVKQELDDLSNQCQFDGSKSCDIAELLKEES